MFPFCACFIFHIFVFIFYYVDKLFYARAMVKMVKIMYLCKVGARKLLISNTPTIKSYADVFSDYAMHLGLVLQ